jgi:hypothetical protein
MLYDKIIPPGRKNTLTSSRKVLDIFLSDINEIYNRSADFHRSAQYKILGKSVHWEPR